MEELNTLSAAQQEAKSAARGTVRSALSRSQGFVSMSLAEQESLYKSMVADEYRKELAKRGIGNGNGALARSLATDSGKDMGYKGYDPAFGGDTQAFKDLVDSVDFPKFVHDLMKAVFDGNLAVMKTQTDTYVKLLREATKDSADFVKQVKDEESFMKLADTKKDKYNVSSEKQPDGSQKLVLTDTQGEKVDPTESEIVKDITEAKIQMAKEHRAALREVLLMGVTRLVVEKGVIEAGVDFAIHATRESKSHHDDQNINVTSIESQFDSGALGSIFGGPSGSMSMTNTNIQINTADKKATDDLTATLHGKVNIQFKTDYFKLDNFLTMYADGGVQALKPAAGPAPPAGLPAGR
jgi:hypothetical protein